MYNERNDGFSIKNLIIQILFIVLFVFILIWLFPTKGDIDKNGGNAGKDFDVLTNRIFNENLQIMKEAAISYYTTSRLPKNVNDVEMMTLRKMLEEKLLIEFKDANNNSCDLDESYVEITKLEDEYILKVNLSCTDNDAYILVHLGCYDYCLTDVCENTNIPASQPIENKPTPEPEQPTPDTPQGTCRYKYQKDVPNYVWSNWSEWSTNVETATATKEVDTKTETTTEEVTKYRDVDYQILVENGRVGATYCSEYGAQYTPTGEKKYEWIDEGTSYYADHPQDTSTTKYEFVNSLPMDCGSCINKVAYEYRKYSLKIYDVVEQDICVSYSTITAPVYRTEWATKQEEYKETITNTINYYRFRTLSTTYTTLTEWSSIQNDQNLIGQGYKYVTSECK